MGKSLTYWFLASVLFLGLCPHIFAEHWALNAVDTYVKVYGKVKTAPGVSGTSLVVDGDSLIELNNSAALNPSDGFTVSVWFNPYMLEYSQQMIIGKNRYSLNERQWGITIEPDGTMKAHLRQDGWSEITCREPLKAGHWHRVTLTVAPEKASLFLNGKPAGEAALKKPIPATKAPITLGGILDGGTPTQQFHGALNEVRFEPRVMSAEEISASYRPIEATHELPKPQTAEFSLWDDSQKLAEAKDLPVLEGVAFHVIKKWDKANDGYTFLHGVGLAWHKGKLYASFAHNKGEENTVTEEAHYRVSEDGGKTWSELRVIDSGEEENLAVSHGVFLSYAGKLWAFHGAYYNKMARIHTRAYSLDESTGHWVKHGVVIEHGFWALNQPVKMGDGNWIMAGISTMRSSSGSDAYPASVAISHGDDLMKWNFVGIPAPKGIRMWGESGIIVDGANVVSIARYGYKPLALVARSDDYGRTWNMMRESNMPMTTSKPAAGMLSSGQRYLVCTTAAKNGQRRSPLTIAVGKPGSPLLSKVFVIRHAGYDGPGESNSSALSYPCAIEHNGYLYIGFSSNGERSGNHNSAEMAVIPIERLK